MRKPLAQSIQISTTKMALSIKDLFSRVPEKDGELLIVHQEISIQECTRTISEMAMDLISSRMEMKREGIGKMISETGTLRYTGLGKETSAGSSKMT